MWFWILFLVSSSVEKRKSDPDDTESSIVFYFFFLFLYTFVSFILFHSCLFSFVTHGSSKWKSFSPPPFGLHLLLTFQQVLESFHERKLCGWLCKPTYIKCCCPIIFIQAVTRKSEEEQEDIQDGTHFRRRNKTTVDGKTRNKFVRQEMP